MNCHPSLAFLFLTIIIKNAHNSRWNCHIILTILFKIKCGKNEIIFGVSIGEAETICEAAFVRRRNGGDIDRNSSESDMVQGKNG